MPKLPPPPRRPQRSSGFSVSLARTRRPSAVTTSAATRLSACEAELPHRPADAAAEREAADAGRRHETAGRGEAVSLRLVVHVGPDGAAADGRATGSRIDANVVHACEGRSRFRRRRSRSRRGCGRRLARRSEGCCCVRSRPRRSRRPHRHSGRRAPASRRVRRSTHDGPRRNRDRSASRRRRAKPRAVPAPSLLRERAH